MVERERATVDGKPRLVANDEGTQGMTCSVSRPRPALWRHPVARLQAAPAPGAPRHAVHAAVGTRQPSPPGAAVRKPPTTASCFLEPDVSHKVSWALSPPPAVNWTVAGILLEADDTLSGSGILKGTVAFEGQPQYSMDHEPRKRAHDVVRQPAATRL